MVLGNVGMGGVVPVLLLWKVSGRLLVVDMVLAVSSELLLLLLLRDGGEGLEDGDSGE